MNEIKNIDFAEKDKEFIKRMYSALAKNSPDIQKFKLAFGRKMTDDLSTYMAFISLCEERKPKTIEHIYFLLTCLFFKTEKVFRDNENVTYVKYQSLLKRVYGDSKTTNKQIERLMDMDFDNNGLFESSFMRLYNRCIKELKGNERFDYLALLKDLKFWNKDDRNVRIKWAYEIISD